MTESMDEGLLDRSSPRKASWESHVTASIVLSSSVAACGYFAYGFAVGYASPAQSGIMDDLGLSIAEYSVFASIMTFGGMIGALISGKVADIFGRRVTIWLLDLFFILGWCSVIFGKRAWWLDAGRLLMGVGSGIQLYVAPIYMSEFALTLGFSLAYYIGNNMNWRTLALVGASPCFIQLLGVFFIPESPRWLDYTKTVQQHSASKFMDMFSRKYARPLIVGTGLMALVQFGGNSAISSYASSVFRAAGCTANSASRVMAVLQITSAGACLGCFLAALGFLLKDYHQPAELTSSMVFSGIMLFSVFFTMGMGGTHWIIMSEILPINIKGSAGSFIALVNCFTSWIVSYAFNFLFQWNAAGVFFLFAFFCGSVVVFVAMLVPETKGRTLEEIQASMTLLK
ncbi:sugar transporter erd6-like 10 [Nicotiana attenuata]|uniref:Sugar transporter erd6-like 10 n=1 Tax=Nicotiana attenuata TaxID=49451 RepID=A0A1J6K838_NICAT|nr:sugar transporter erd6-like 10 [Nicotiana attenuata]